MALLTTPQVVQQFPRGERCVSMEYYETDRRGIYKSNAFATRSDRDPPQARSKYTIPGSTPPATNTNLSESSQSVRGYCFSARAGGHALEIETNSEPPISGVISTLLAVRMQEAVGQYATHCQRLRLTHMIRSGKRVVIVTRCAGLSSPRRWVTMSCSRW